MTQRRDLDNRIVITGIGLTAPNGNDLKSYRGALLEGKGGLDHIDIRYMGQVVAGLCDFDETKHMKKKNRRRGTRAGSIAVYCASEAIEDSQIDWEQVDRSRVGIYVGITEHGNVETEEEVFQISQNNYDPKLWSIHHNPRTVANNPAGEVSLIKKITGPHYTIGSACAGGNMGLIQGIQMLRLNEVDMAIAGGVSESPNTFGIFAAFASQGALCSHENPALASRPLDKNRNGIAISEGGCLYTLERLGDALARGAKIYGEITGYAVNSDASDYVNPNSERQVQCIDKALAMAQIGPQDIDIVNLHATGTQAGDINEMKAVKAVFDAHPEVSINCNKALIGHCMGAAGALELAGNLPSFEDGMVHGCYNIEHVDPECDTPGLVIGGNKKKTVRRILNNSFGMLGINSSVIVEKYEEL